MLANRAVEVKPMTRFIRLNETQDEADIRIHYTWGSAKFARYFCSYKIPGRLVVNRAFAGPGSQ